MNPAKVTRARLRRLTDLPNVGPAMARDFETLGFRSPDQLKGRDPLKLYQALCRATSARHDPCVLDVFLSVTRFLGGDPPKPWWSHTKERKRLYGNLP